MKKYIGCKMVEAEPCVKVNGKLYDCLPDMDPTKGAIIEYGYKVRYEDGYESFSPKAVFEKAYLEIGADKTITRKTLDSFIARIERSTIGEQNTEVKVTLVNGYELVKEVAFASAEVYDEELGARICLGEIEDKILLLLDFLLQTALNGVKRVENEAEEPVKVIMQRGGLVRP